MPIGPRFSVNGRAHGENKDPSLPDRQHKANEAVAGIMEEINKLLAEAEKQLRAKYRPAQDTSVPYPEGCWDNHPWARCALVGFIKCEADNHPPTWRLCYRSHDENQNYPEQCLNDTGWMPLAECPRSLRAEVVSALPKLLPELQEQIVKGTEELIVRATNAKAALQKALAALQSTPNQA